MDSLTSRSVAQLLTRGLPNDPLFKLLGVDLVESFIVKHFSLRGELFVEKNERDEVIGVLMLGQFSMAFFLGILSKLKFWIVSRHLWSPKFLIEVLSALLSLLKESRPTKSIEILWIVVDINCRGIGVGKTLIHKAKSSFVRSDFQHLYVKTLVSTPLNIKFYENQGFKIISKRFGRVTLRLEK